MSEYKNGVNAFGNMSVGKDDRVAEVKTGRAVFVDDDKYEEDPEYKLKVDKCLAEGFHRVGSSESGSGDYSTAKVTIVNDLDPGNTVGVGGPFIVDNTLIYMGEVETGTFVGTCVLYKGHASVLVAAAGVTVTGNATQDEYESGGCVVHITGDCTIEVHVFQ